MNISNNSEATIYFFVLDQGFAAKANWHAISTKEIAIQSKKMAKVPLSEIAGYNLNNEIILYYWKTVDPQQKEISHILVDK